MRNLLLITLLLFTTLSCWGQQSKAEKREQMNALKVKFFTEELDLSIEESKQFWPVYYQFEKEHTKAKKTIRFNRKELATNKLTKEELKKSLNDIYKIEILLADSRRQMILSCIPILGVEKSTKLVSLEDQLRKKLADRVKHRIEERPQ